jgi:hypothetical protein
MAICQGEEQYFVKRVLCLDHEQAVSRDTINFKEGQDVWWHDAVLKQVIGEETTRWWLSVPCSAAAAPPQRSGPAACTHARQLP